MKLQLEIREAERFKRSNEIVELLLMLTMKAYTNHTYRKVEAIQTMENGQYIHRQ